MKSRKNTKTKTKKQVSNKIIKNKKQPRKNKKQQRGGAVDANIPQCLNPEWRPMFTTLVRLLDIDGTPLEVYGTSLPVNDRQDLTNTLLYYMYRKQIRRIMSFQACSDPMCPPVNKQYCPQPNVFLEDKTWNSIKNTIPGAPASQPTNKNDPEFIPLINNLIQDLTAGNLSNWLLFSKYNVHIESERLLVHCYAGLGRTGSALLYFLLTRRVKMFPNYFIQKWWGLGGSREMMLVMRDLINNNIRLELDTNSSINDKIKAFDINIIPQELFKMNKLYDSNLFVTRVNYIILMLAYRNNIPINTPIYLYTIPCYWPVLPFGSLDDDDILFYPILFIFKGWDSVNAMSSAQNQFGITTIIPASAPASAPANSSRNNSFGLFRMS